MEEGEWVHIVALNSDGKILLTRQYRHAANVICNELPCGVANEAEDPLEAAKRELREETGYVADEWTKLAVLFANPARQTNRIHCFLARGLKKVSAQTLDETEEISFEFVSQDEVLRQIENGDFCQALSCGFILSGRRIP
jgi:ADP-ribose pyrophosphatase